MLWDVEILGTRFKDIEAEKQWDAKVAGARRYIEQEGLDVRPTVLAYQVHVRRQEDKRERFPRLGHFNED